jgi:hypothetical protein
MAERSQSLAAAPAVAAVPRFLAVAVAVILAAIAWAVTAGLAPAKAPLTSGTAAAEDPTRMNSLAESYVKLVLAVGQHDANYVDAFYGPAEWKQAAEAAGKRPLAELEAQAHALLASLAALPAPPIPPTPPTPPTPPDSAGDAAGKSTGDGAGKGDGESESEMLQLRRRYLERQLSALAAHVAALSGTRRSFDEESRALYDAVAPTYDAAHFQAILDGVDRIVPGHGLLAARIEDYRRRFVIPPDRLDGVFSAAIAECRRRTAAHIALPPGESFEVAYVKDKPWSGYNWYQGGFRSLIQVNTDLPIFIDRAVDLAGHEGYPGHHVYNALLEQHLVRERGWVELTVYPLFSPQSLIAEGTANFGVEVVFPGPERVAFERQVLYPKAGLDPAGAANYDRLQELLRQLSYAGNEAARGYLDGKLTREAAHAWLVRYALMSPERAAQRLRFIDTYRSYVINYNYGQDLVRRYVESRGGTVDRPDRRWREFARLISSPRLPSDLR